MGNRKQGLLIAVVALGAVLSAAMLKSLPDFPESQPIKPVSGNTQGPPAEAETSSPNGNVMANDDVPGVPYSSVMQKQTPQAVQASFPSKPKRAPRTGQYVTIQNKQYAVQTYELMLTPNDPFANQWWLTNSRLTQAWDLPTPATATTLAIIDTGFALQHEEFANRWATNAGEQGATASEAASSLNCADRGLPLDQSCNLIDDNGDTIVDNESGATSSQNPSFKNCTDQALPLDKSCNRTDDDSNGYVDDVLGWDFVNYDNSAQAGQTNPSGTGTTHGSMVAGVAAATGNNGRGIAGANWNTKILPIQALDDDSYGDTLTVGNAIRYAVMRGANVINLSLGTSVPDTYVREAVEAATKAGVLVVASSGNDGCNCIVYPAGFPEVLAVGALGTNGAPASFSSYGTELDVMAPGTSITTSTWTAGNPTAAYVSGVAGTSFSSPLVAGIVTALRANEPTASPLQIIGLLTEQANRAAIAAGTVRNNSVGFGAADAYAAISRAQTSRQVSQIYGLSPTSLGNYLAPLSPPESVTPALIHDCQGQIATTPIYELISSASRFYTISKVESRQATTSGYTSTLFAYGCITQPQDNTGTFRAIDIPREFRNIYNKL